MRASAASSQLARRRACRVRRRTFNCPRPTVRQLSTCRPSPFSSRERDLSAGAAANCGSRATAGHRNGISLVDFCPCRAGDRPYRRGPQTGAGASAIGHPPQLSRKRRSGAMQRLTRIRSRSGGDGKAGFSKTLFALHRDFFLAEPCAGDARSMWAAISLMIPPVALLVLLDLVLLGVGGVPPGFPVPSPGR